MIVNQNLVARLIGGPQGQHILENPKTWPKLFRTVYEFQQAVENWYPDAEKPPEVDLDAEVDSDAENPSEVSEGVLENPKRVFIGGREFPVTKVEISPDSVNPELIAACPSFRAKVPPTDAGIMAMFADVIRAARGVPLYGGQRQPACVNCGDLGTRIQHSLYPGEPSTRVYCDCEAATKRREKAQAEADAKPWCKSCEGYHLPDQHFHGMTPVTIDPNLAVDLEAARATATQLPQDEEPKVRLSQDEAVTVATEARVQDLWKWLESRLRPDCDRAGARYGARGMAERLARDVVDICLVEDH